MLCGWILRWMRLQVASLATGARQVFSNAAVFFMAAEISLDKEQKKF